MQREILAEYEILVGKRTPPSVRLTSERLRALQQLKADGLISEEEYSSKRKSILGEP
jgi:Short C-terminal domain